jgi:hypothetical protein
MHDLPLPTIDHARPCNSSWDLMEGDSRVRRCSNCKQDVYRDEDGTLTRNCGDARARVPTLMPTRRIVWVATWVMCILLAWATALLVLSAKIHEPVYADSYEIDGPDPNL